MILHACSMLRLIILDACVALLLSSYSSCLHFIVVKSFFMRLVEKFQGRKMDGALVGQAIDPHNLVVGDVMEVNREDSVHSAVYPCQNFMTAAGILQDFNTLIF